MNSILERFNIRNIPIEFVHTFRRKQMEKHQYSVGILVGMKLRKRTITYIQLLIVFFFYSLMSLVSDSCSSGQAVDSSGINLKETIESDK